MRLGEAPSLKVEDLDIPQSCALVRTAKNGDLRGVFLPPVLVAALASHPSGLDRAGKNCSVSSSADG
jgi:integrase